MRMDVVREVLKKSMHVISKNILKPVANFFKDVLPTVTAICLVALTYQQYQLQKVNQEPFFRIEIRQDYDAAEQSNITEWLVIHNDGGVARSVRARIFSFYAVNEYTVGLKDNVFYVPATYFDTSFHSSSSKGRIMSFVGLGNVRKLGELNTDLMAKNPIKSVSLVHYLIVNYTTITGEHVNVIFCSSNFDYYVVDKIPKSFVEFDKAPQPLHYNSLSASSIQQYIESGFFALLEQ